MKSRLSEMPEDDFVGEVYGMVLKASINLSAWREEARESYGFVAGDQYSVEDIEKLKEEDRPAVTFNRTDLNVEAIIGIDINNEQEILPFPRDVGDAKVNETVAGGIKYVRDRAYIIEEEGEVFYDLLVAGVGAAEISVDYSEDPEGRIVVLRNDPLACAWDPSSVRRNLMDRRWDAREKKMDFDEVDFLWPDALKALGISESNHLSMLSDSGHVTINDPARKYSGTPLNVLDEDAFTQETAGEEFTVLDFEWFEYSDVVRFQDPVNGNFVTMLKKRFNKVKQDLGIIKFVELKKKVFYRAFMVNGILLERGEGASTHNFTRMFVTGKRDRANHSWYGMVRAIKDPQRWANKFFSSMIEIISKSAKGGAYAEADAFVNEREAEEQWAKASPLIMMKRGGINRVKDRAMGQYPSGIERVMAFSVESIRDVSGINVELLGLADRRQAGVVETTRKQAALTLVSRYFRAMRLFREIQGRLILEFMRKYLPPDKLMRIDSGNEQRVLELQEFLSDEDVSEFDIIVDEAPFSVNVKERTWFALQQVLPALLQQGIPIPPSVVDYAPIPPSLAQEWKQLLANFVLPGPSGAGGGTASSPSVTTTSPQNENEQNSVLQDNETKG